MVEQQTDEPLVGRVTPCRMVQVPEHADERGTLAAIEIGETIDFVVKRVYYMRGMPNGVVRGAHGHRNLRQLLLALNGSFDVTVDDGFRRTRFRLEDPSLGLYIGPMVWRSLTDFSPGAVGLVLASEHYDEDDYYRAYPDFLRAARRMP